MQPTPKFKLVLGKSLQLKRYLFFLLVLSLMAVSLLAEASVLYLLALFPIGFVFNLYYFKYVTGVHPKTPTAISIDPGACIADVEYYGGDSLNGRIKSLSWESPGLVILQIKRLSGGNLWLPVFKDSVTETEFRQLKTWLKTGF